MNPYKITIEASNPDQLKVNIIALAATYTESADRDTRIEIAPLGSEHVNATVLTEDTMPTLTKAKVSYESATPTAITANVSVEHPATAPITTNPARERIPARLNDEGIATSSEPPESQFELPLAKVRAKLAKLTKEGKSNEVVTALQAFGCTRLTDVQPADYASLLDRLGVTHE